MSEAEDGVKRAVLPSVPAQLEARLSGYARVLADRELDRLLPRWTDVPGAAGRCRRAAVGPQLDAALTALFVRTPAGRGGQDALRRRLRLAQVDAELDPRADVPDTLPVLVEVLRRLLEGVGRGAGGAAVAALGWAALIARAAEHGRPATVGARSAAPLLLSAVAEAARAGRSGGAGLDPIFALLPSPVALGLHPEELARRPVNAYRTVPAAVGLARRILVPPLSGVPLRRVAGAIAERLEADPEVSGQLARAARIERIREAALAALATEPDPEPLAPLAIDPRALASAVGVEGRRGGWVSALRGRPGRASAALLGQLEGQDRPGDAGPRARWAAAGAVAAVLDAQLAAVAADRFAGAAFGDDPERWRRGGLVRLEAGEGPALWPTADVQGAVAVLELEVASLDGAAGRLLWRRIVGDLLDPALADGQARASPGWLEVLSRGAGLEARGHPAAVLAVAASWGRRVTAAGANAGVGVAAEDGQEEGLGRARAVVRARTVGRRGIGAGQDVLDRLEEAGGGFIELDRLHVDGEAPIAVVRDSDLLWLRLP